MSEIEFSKGEKDLITEKIQRYFVNELDQEIGQFDAEFLLDFFSEELGGYFYNRGLNDAQLVVKKTLELMDETIDEKIYAIEKPTDFNK
ncbi:MAG: DUF2164 domain-containing protein [Arenicella sp.]